MLRAFQLGKTSIADDLVFPSEAGTPICPDNIGPRDMELDAQISSMRYLLKTERMNDGIARALLVIFKVLAQTEDPRLMPGLGGWAEELMASINIGKLNKGGPVATNLLIALERASPGYLAAFAGERKFAAETVRRRLRHPPVRQQNAMRWSPEAKGVCIAPQAESSFSSPW